MKRKVIKETPYCMLLNQTFVSDSDYTYAIERIIVKSKQTEEIRFAVYKELAQGERMLVRPLDMEEDLLFKLLQQAVQQKVFSTNFTKKIAKIVELNGEQK